MSIHLRAAEGAPYRRPRPWASPLSPARRLGQRATKRPFYIDLRRSLAEGNPADEERSK